MIKMSFKEKRPTKAYAKDVEDLIKKQDTRMRNEVSLLGVEVLTQAQSLAPYKTGALEAGIRLQRMGNQHMSGFTISASAINPNTGYDYAMIQHENLDYKHTKGQAKYIEQPMQEAVDRFATRMKGAI